MTGTVEVLARFATARRFTAATPVACQECSTDVTAGEMCPACGQLATAAGTVGVLAVAYTAGSGERRIVVATRTAGGWAPSRTYPYSTAAARALRRQATTSEALR